MKRIILAISAICLVFAGPVAYAEESTVLFGFEEGLAGWNIPDWAYEKPDHVQKKIGVSGEYASEGTNSMEIEVEFPGGKWTGAIAEIMQYFDWTDYSAVACDVYLPEDAPEGLRASIILTVGDSWKWVEMSRSYALVPGEWVTLTGDLTPGSVDWRRVHVDDAFRQDVRKMHVRVVSNNRPAYTGSVYVDNVRVIK